MTPHPVLVDAHVHVWDAAAGPDDRLGSAGTIERLVATFDEHSVTRGVLIQPSYYGTDHRYLLAALESVGDRLVGVALAEPDDPTGLDALAAVAAVPAIRGIRVPLIRAPADWLSAAGEAVWRVAQESSCVVCAFVMPEQLADLHPWLELFPDVPVAVDHLAGLDLADDRGTATMELLSDLARRPNVYVKASSLPAISRESFPHRDVWPAVWAVLDSFGHDRVLWGSDYPAILPYGTYGESVDVARLALATLPSEVAVAVLGGTALRLFFGSGA